MKACRIAAATMVCWPLGTCARACTATRRKGALEEGEHALVNVLAQLGDLALGDARQPHRLHEIVNSPRRDAGDPGLLDHGDKGPLGGLAGLQEGREVAARGSLGILRLSDPSRVSRVRSR